MPHVTIRFKLAFTFSVLVALILVQGYFAIDRLDAVNRMATEMEVNWLPATRLVGELNTTANEYRAAEAIHILARSTDDKERYEEELKRLAAVMERLMHAYEPTITSTEERQIFDDVVRGWTSYLHYSRDLVALSRAYDDDGANALFRGKSRTVFRPTAAALDQLAELNVQGGVAVSQKSRTIFTFSRAMLAGLIVAGALLAAVMATLITYGVARPVRHMTDALKGLAAGDATVAIPSTDRRDEIGAMARAADVFKTMAQRTEAQHWVKSTITDLSKSLQQAETPHDFADTLMRRLVPLMDGGMGVFYAFDEGEERLSLLGSYGFRARKTAGGRYALGEGLVGQCALERAPIELTDVPDDYVAISSGLGEAPPRRILAVPMVFKDRLLGVVEIGSFKPFTDRQQSLLDELMPVAALILENLERARRTQDLLAETQRQSQALKASEEELRLQSEQLQSTNEELRAKSESLAQQTEELQASDEELRAQREELQAINEELTEKSTMLEERGRALEQARQEAEERARELGRASQYKSEFLANMSHELRTPLNSMLILSRLLADNEEGNLSADQIQSAKIMHESGTLLLRLINDILDLSKIEAGKVEVHKEDVPLASVADTLHRKFKHMAEAKGLGLEVALSPSLPDTIVTDGGKLDQILTNIIGNALKFTEQGHVRILFDRAESGALAVSVTDTGIGIPADKLDRIFQAFEQVDGTTSRRFGGTGLGLSISLRLAQLLGGELRVRSVLGEGSTFTLLLPFTSGTAPRLAAPPQPQASHPAPPSPAPASPSGTARSQTILIIEDDPVFARVLCDLAERKGFRAIHAPDGERGLQLALAERPTGIVLDVGLPRLDGWAVIDRLKADPATTCIPVHFVSAAADSDKGLEKGADSFLIKPVTREQIDAVLDALSHGTTPSHKRLLVVDASPGNLREIADLLEGENIEVIGAPTGAAALDRLGCELVDGIVLDVDLPDMAAKDLLSKARKTIPGGLPPVVIHAHRPLTREETLELREYTDSVVVQSGRSQERLLDEVRLFLHSVQAKFGGAKVAPSPENPADAVLNKRTVLVVDDDMRNAFALSKLLRGHGLKVLIAEDGHKALAQLDQHADVDIVLMDIMMPGMDGYETMRRIRAQDRLKDLPILALTAKAMRGDHELCLQAGANDYLSKPVDTDQLLALMRTHLSKTLAEA